MTENVPVPASDETARVEAAAQETVRQDNPVAALLRSSAGRNAGLVVALLILCVVGAATAGDRFASTDNALTILKYATTIGVEAADEAALVEVVERLRSAGHPPVAGTAEQAAARRVEELFAVEAPFGVRVELVRGLAAATTPFASDLVPGGFLTEGVGFGHAVFGTTAFDESHDFVTRGLGMEQSDWLEMELAPGIELEVRFYHCNGRHHTLALAKAPFELPQKLHHVMVEANDRDDVGAAFDRAWATELPIPNGLGRHPNDGMFSFYVASPAGFQVEVGHGGRVVPEDWDGNRRYDRISAWGHQPLRAG